MLTGLSVYPVTPTSQPSLTGWRRIDIANSTAENGAESGAPFRVRTTWMGLEIMGFNQPSNSPAARGRGSSCPSE
jgi:hypothetical protein